MADPSPWHSQQQNMNKDSAVLDLEGVDIQEGEDSASDYEPGSSTPPVHGEQKEQQKGQFMDDVRQRMSENVTQMVWNAGKQSARRAWSIYGNIDILRPYFDVEPKEVQKRLLHSLIPQKPTSQRQRVPTELYGPLMVIFTMIALLLYQMKVSSHTVEEGTLMGSAFIVCFTYWFGASSFIWFLAYVCNVRIAMLQVLSMMGYSLFGHCIVLFLGTVIHTTHDHLFFYLLWASIGGLSALKMAGVILSRASGKTERLIVIAVIVALHMLFLLYLHFAYHSIVEEMSHVFDGHQHEPINPDVAKRIADDGLKVNIGNPPENMIEKVTKKIVEALHPGGHLKVDNIGIARKSLNASINKVVREAVPPVRIASLVSHAVNGSRVIVAHA